MKCLVVDHSATIRRIVIGGSPGEIRNGTGVELDPNSYNPRCTAPATARS
jgi:hypothetical protein